MEPSYISNLLQNTIKVWIKTTLSCISNSLLQGEGLFVFVCKVITTLKKGERRQQYNKVVIIREGELPKGG